MVSTPGVTYKMFKALADEKDKYIGNIYLRDKIVSYNR